jgi:hypothetical protein
LPIGKDREGCLERLSLHRNEIGRLASAQTQVTCGPHPAKHARNRFI